MKIAATYEDGEVFQHFGRTPGFKVYNVDGGKIVSSEVVLTNGVGHGSLIGFLQQMNVEALICGGIGGGAVNLMEEAGIDVCAGIKGNADKAVETYAAGKLEYSSNASCDHHDSDHVCKMQPGD